MERLHSYLTNLLSGERKRKGYFVVHADGVTGDIINLSPLGHSRIKEDLVVIHKGLIAEEAEAADTLLTEYIGKTKQLESEDALTGRLDKRIADNFSRILRNGKEQRYINNSLSEYNKLHTPELIGEQMDVIDGALAESAELLAC